MHRLVDCPKMSGLKNNTGFSQSFFFFKNHLSFFNTIIQILYLHVFFCYLQLSKVSITVRTTYIHLRDCFPSAKNTQVGQRKYSKKKEAAESTDVVPNFDLRENTPI